MRRAALTVKCRSGSEAVMAKRARSAREEVMGQESLSMWG